ncbi:MAG TPA: biotin/lipoyl-binding protein [Candidatus Ozemobacteraceae bacterium]|nr:biotin/lipoyl-binding protein [Candidatus Ozemobacteraceae bacterium]
MTRSEKTSKIYYLIIAVIAIAIIALAGTGLLKIRSKLAMARPMESRPLAARIVKVETGQVEKTIAALATVKSAATVQIKAETGGKILSLPLREGDRVKAGQVIGLIDSREQDAQLQAAKARNQSASNQVAATAATLQMLTSQIDAAQTNFEFWTGELKRDEELYQAGAIAQTAFENTRNRHAEAQSRLTSLKSQIQSQKSQVDALLSQKTASEKDVTLWQVRRDYTELTSPVDGIISARLQEEGNRVLPGVAVYNIEDTTKTRLIMQVPQEAAAKIEPGQPVSLRSHASASFSVSRVFPVLNELRQVIVEAETQTLCPGLVYDMQIPVRIAVERGAGTVIPEEARFVDFSRSDRFFVYVVKNDMALRTSVKAVLEGDNGMTLVNAAEIPPETVLAVGSYLENIRLPASFAIEVVR